MTCHSHRAAAAPAYGAGVRRSARARLRARKRRRRRRFFLCAAAVLALGLAATRLAPSLSTGRGSPAGAAALSLSTGAGALSGETRAALEALCEADARAAAILDDPGAYPAELVELLVTAPDALDLVLAWPDIRDTPPADSVGALTDGEVPLLFQWDTRWGLAPYGGACLAVSGCGPTALSMVAAGLTGDDAITPAAVAAWADAHGYAGENGTSWELLRTGCEHFGVRAEELPLSEASVSGALCAGRPIICSMRPGDFTTTGHLIVLTGWQDGLLAVHDPNSRARSAQLWEYSAVSGQIRNLWAYDLL